ncbi:hypothetical protein C8Q74DRAFT_345760 [Fomes fomentarius]|nr:hypothetical protein C8Q74DRAFT_345760 [Fomes fomentarius]
MPADTTSSSQRDTSAIKALDARSVHNISSGQVVVDLQTAVKELVENSLDAGATNIEVRFKQYGLESFEVVDNGSGIRPEDYDSIALKHHTSKLTSFTDLESVATFGFRGEALSSLCALAESVSVTTATASEAPVGTVIQFERTGQVKNKKGKAARQRGTTVTVSGLFKPLPVRRKELERNAKREFGKALTLLHAYALVPCAKENKGVRLTVTNQTAGGKKTVQLRTDGTPSTRASVSAIWGPKALENLVELEVRFAVEVEAAVLRRQGRARDDESSNEVRVCGLISKFVVGSGRNGNDRQFFFVNGRPCAPTKKALNEVYRSFNATQSPFVIADFILPPNSCDINVSPDKRTILLHSENNLVQSLRRALEEKYAPARSTFDVNVAGSQLPDKASENVLPLTAAGVPAPGSSGSNPQASSSSQDVPLFLPDEVVEDGPSSSGRDGAVQDASGESPVDPVEVDELTFGDPTLLSDLRTSSPSQKDINVEVEANVPRQRHDLELDDVPMSPTVTQMTTAKEISRPHLPLASDDALDHSSSGAHRRSSPSPDADDAPIPSLRLPTRPSVRSSPQPRLPTSTSCMGVKGKGEQMVLSTEGAAWNLRTREAEEERPRKKSRLEPAAASASGVQARREAQRGMRDLLRGFARKGSRVEEVDMSMDVDAEDQDEDEDEAAASSGEEDEDGNKGGKNAASMNVDMEVDEEDPGRGSVDESADESSDIRAGVREPPDTEPSSSGVDVEPMDSDPEEDERTVPAQQVMSTTHPDAGRGRGKVSRPRSDLGGKSSISATSEEIVRTGERESVWLSFDVSRVAASWERLRSSLKDAVRERRDREEREERERVTLNSAAGVGSAADNEEAAEALSRVIEKRDFERMEVIGQFNLGFIVVRRRKSASAGNPSDSGNSNHSGAGGTDMDDLFIVDQHAADEKYNFETLQKTTRIDSQKLFRPQILELTAADELVAVENVDILRQNGFELDISEERAPGRRMQLTAQPISKSTVFDMKDLEELLHLMHDQPAGQMVRCSKARAMFASRACRKSIMIGTPLNRRQMMSVIQHMGTMDQPWHCPHGRPTMRHLSDIVGAGWDCLGRSIDWAAFGRTVVASEG